MTTIVPSQAAARLLNSRAKVGLDRWLSLVGVVLAALSLAAPRPIAAQQVDPSVYEGLPWRHLGPPGNRAISAVGEPGNWRLMLVGAASGGIWRTEDGGIHWNPVFDDQPVSSVGELEVSSTAPHTYWAGTGEIYYIRPFTSIGNGVYKSTDEGRTWTHMGLDETGRIGRILIHPYDPQVVYVCALGDAHGPQQSRGVYKTTDGGQSWERVLFVNEGTGCADMAMDPADPSTLFAGMWQVTIHPWNLNSGGPDGGVYVTHDAGQSWTHVRGGLPEGTVGKVSVDVARTNPQRVYALIEESPDPGLYRSDDGGRSWRLMNRDHVLLERPAYYARLRVSPEDQDLVYVAGVQWSLTRDGGSTVHQDVPAPGGDNHNIWVDPELPRRVLVSNDGGLGYTLDGGRTWDRVQLPIGQVYHVTTDTRVPYQVYVNRQDGPSFYAPSNTRRADFLSSGSGGGPIYPSDWRNFGGCESGWGVPDTTSNRYVYSGCYDGGMDVVDLNTHHARSIEVWPLSAIGWAPKDIKERFHWTFPIALSPHDPSRVYVGSQRIHLSTNRGQSWQVISPDLTRNDTTHELSSGGVTGDNLQTFDGAVLYAIAESPVEEGVIWAGSNDGLVHLTRNGGQDWTDLTPNIPDLPHWIWVQNIEPSHFMAGTAYLAATNHLMGDHAPYLYKTEDYGASWKRIDAGIPRSVASYTHVIREDPKREGMLYAGTENAVYFSLDDGAHWQRIKGDMPTAPAYWITVQPHFDDLLVGTYGRGVWILDDMKPLRELTPEVLESAVHLFPPRTAYRFQPTQGGGTPQEYHMGAQNPAYGADLNYYLGSVPDGEVRIAIVGPDGDTVRTLKGPATKGINRVNWDLRYESFDHPRMFNEPPGRSWVTVPDTGFAPIAWGSGFDRGPKAAPGTYTVVLKVGDATRTGTVEVVKDPYTTGTMDDIRQQVSMSLALRQEYGRLTRAVTKLEWVRRQLSAAEASLGSDGNEDLAQAVAAARQKVRDVEVRFIDINLTGGREDSFRNPSQLHGRYLELMRDLDGSADYAPTDQQRQVHEVLEGQLQEAETAYRDLLSQDLSTLNERLRAAGLPGVAAAEASESRPRPSPLSLQGFGGSFARIPIH